MFCIQSINTFTILEIVLHFASMLLRHLINNTMLFVSFLFGCLTGAERITALKEAEIRQV